MYHITYSLQYDDDVDKIIAVQLFETAPGVKILWLAARQSEFLRILLKNPGRLLSRDLGTFDEVVAIPMFKALALEIDDCNIWATSHVAFTDDDCISLMEVGDLFTDYAGWKDERECSWEIRDGEWFFYNQPFPGKVVPVGEAIIELMRHFAKTGHNPCWKILGHV